MRPAAAGHVGSAHSVHLAGDLTDGEAMTRRRHRRQPLPAIGLRVKCFVRAIGADKIVQVGLAAEDVHKTIQHGDPDPAPRGRHAYDG